MATLFCFYIIAVIVNIGKMTHLGPAFAGKALIRKEIRLKLRSLTRIDREFQSRIIADKVLAHLKYQSSQGVAVFVSLPDEVDTCDIIRDVFRSGRKCYIPRYAEGGSDMTMVRVVSEADLESLPKTKWNIPQPLESDVREDCLITGGIDLILTPGLAFTVSGCRLGRGKGYYDNFLRFYCSLFPAPFVAGLALRQSIVETIPTTPNDVNLDCVLHPDL